MIRRKTNSVEKVQKLIWRFFKKIEILIRKSKKITL